MRERREQGRNESPAFRGLVYICGVGGVLSDRDSKVRGKPQRQLDHMTLPRDWSPKSSSNFALLPISRVRALFPFS